MPGGFTERGTPLAFQFVGADFSEGTLLAAAHAYQQVTDHHRQPLSSDSPRSPTYFGSSGDSPRPLVEPGERQRIRVETNATFPLYLGTNGDSP